MKIFGLNAEKESKKELWFLSLMAVFAVAAAFLYKNSAIAMWAGFLLAGYSAIANDSIQTLGTFLASNSRRPWWLLWFFIGGILAAVFIAGWYVNGGDLAFGRLERIPQPATFSYVQLLSPIILIVITYYKMPVSTTFLILSVFSSSKTIGGMLEKTFIGYVVAFGLSLIIWGILGRIMKKYNHLETRRDAHGVWTVLQWCSTAFLWASWLMQDTANISVYLPRTLDFTQLMAVAGLLFLLIGVLFYIKGGRIQQVVTEKTDIIDVRPATLIDFVYALILLVFQQWNDLPMSTTWVFLGLLAGRELALAQVATWSNPYKRSALLVLKDIGRASVGLLISLALALIGSLYGS